MNKTFDGLIVSLITVVTMRLWFAVWGAAAILSGGSGIATDLPAFFQTLVRDPSEVLRLFLTPWQRWDANWYLRIAEFGYSPDDASPAFFPLFPLLIRSAAALLGQNYLLANLVICTIAAFGAFVFLYLVSVDLVGKAAATRAVVYWAIFPTSYYLFGGYAEPVLAVSALASLYFARRKHWWAACLASASATLARPVGFLIAVPLAVEAWLAGNSLRERLPAVIPIAGVFAAMGMWMLYLEIAFHDALLWVHAEEAWQRVFVFPGLTVLWTIQNIQSGEGPVANNIVDFGLTFIALAASLAALKKLPISFSVYSFLMLIVPLLSYSGAGTFALLPMAAAGRRALVVFPVFIALADKWRGKWQVRLWTAISVTLQVILFIAFVQWFWVD